MVRRPCLADGEDRGARLLAGTGFRRRGKGSSLGLWYSDSYLSGDLQRHRLVRPADRSSCRMERRSALAAIRRRASFGGSLAQRAEAWRESPAFRAVRVRRHRCRPFRQAELAGRPRPRTGPHLRSRLQLARQLVGTVSNRRPSGHRQPVARRASRPRRRGSKGISYQGPYQRLPCQRQTAQVAFFGAIHRRFRLSDPPGDGGRLGRFRTHPFRAVAASVEPGDAESLSRRCYALRRDDDARRPERTGGLRQAGHGRKALSHQRRSVLHARHRRFPLLPRDRLPGHRPAAMAQETQGAAGVRLQLRPLPILRLRARVL